MKRTQRLHKHLVVFLCTLTATPCTLLRAAGSSTVAVAADAEAIYKEALITETGERDLEKAISLYQKTIEQASNAPDLAAKAQFRIAQCQEKAGKTDEAIAAYGTLIDHPTNVPMDVLQDAQISRDRLQKQLAQAQQLTDQQNLVASYKKPYSPRWVLDLEGGYTLLQTHGDVFDSVTDPYEHRYDVAWGGLGYRLTKHFQLGIEGGNLFRRETDQSSSISEGDSYGDTYSDSSRVSLAASHYYIGAYVQQNTDVKRFTFQGRLGAGIMQTNADLAQTSDSVDCYSGQCTSSSFAFSQNYQVTDPATTMSLGVEYNINSHIGVALGLRDILVLVRETVETSYNQVNNVNTYSYSSSADYRLVARNLLMPFGRLSLKW